MELHFIPIFAALLLGVVVSHAALPSEVYWQNMLPNTPMPKAVRDLLRPDFVEEKNTYVGVGKGGVGVDTNKPGGSSTSVGVGKGGVVVDNRKPSGKGTSVNVGKGGVHVGTGKPGGGTTVNVGHKGGVAVNTGKPGGRTKVNVGKGGVGVDTGHKGKPVIVRVHPGPNPFEYKYAASANQLQDDPNSALFFLEKDLHPGTKMNLHFIKTTDGATFLPHQLAKSMPFSSNKLPDILNRFLVDPKSVEADAIKQTIKECEEPSNDKEEKYCATSLESMVEFSTSKLGTNVRALATEVLGKEETQKQQYVIISGVKKMAGDDSVVCHSQTYLYAVFYCHATHTTKAYVVPLVGADGTKIKAVAVCHTDTSTWNPKHLAFQVLKVKPGTVPVCHFLPEDHIVWVAKN
ncbi:BURP domain [Macleaya cordata]|uniref:BURP domain n=1 Tax=Macleaya cordata TaxID=56857 RepID=A0A200PP06_MACCD|nr:BURP domain [Macleaya cordata]